MAETNTEVQAPAPGTAEHDAAMAKKFDDAQQPPADTGKIVSEPAARPEGVPEKFWDAEKGAVRTEELLKSYAELEKARNTPPKKEEQPPKTESQPKEGEQQQGEQTPVVTTLLNSAFTEYATDGSVKPETRAALVKAGIPENVLDDHIAGQVALSTNLYNEGVAVVGGEENFTAMRSWAEANLKPAELDAFNSAVLEGTREEMLQALRGMHARYTQETGNDPKRVLQGGKAASDEFQNWAQVTEAMKDKRYGKDKAYTDRVAAKVGRSKQLG